MTKRANVLTVSLIAIFAATGVRAEIASKAYVDQQVDSVEAKVDTHTANTTMHITAAERTAWNAKQDALSAGSNVDITNNTISVADATDSVKGVMTKAEVYDDTLSEAQKKATAASVWVAEEAAQAAAAGAVATAAGTYQKSADSKVGTGTYNKIVAGNGVATNLVNLDTAVGDIDTKIGAVATGKTVVGMISDAQTAAAADATSKANAAQAAAEATAAADATSKANAAEAAAKAYTDTATTNMQVTTNLITDLDANKTATDKYPSAKAVYDAVEAAKSAASGGATDALQDAKDYADGKFQVKSTGASIGGANGTWTALTNAQLAAMNSGATTTNIGKIATNESAIATLNGDATVTGSVAKKISDAITALDLANTYDAKGSAAAAQTAAVSAAAADATSKANAAEAAAKSYTDTATTNMQVTTNLITDLDANKTATDKYPSAKAVYDAVEAAKTAASGAYQPKSTTDRQIGTTGGLWRALTANEAAALDSGITTAKVSGYDSTKSAVENATTGLAATKAIADSAKTTAEAALPAATYNSQVGTVSAANMGTTATTVVGAIKEVSDAIDDLDTTYAKDSDVTSGLALKQDKTDSTATAGNYIAAGTGVGANLGALDSQLKTTTDTANAAIPKPSGTCTDCVLHFNGTAYAWEEVGR